ncbi:MAG TPA: hypothetical protein VME66_12590 [Candidatus Acidoferrales bacterium]|nr:hypothetical protein [Candidatus Acidoferrales bacterium]
MKRISPIWFMLCAFLAAAVAAPAQTTPPVQAAPSDSGVPSDATTQQAVSSDLFVRMCRVNANLKSYKADLHVDTAMHTFPYISPALDGNVYFKQPDSLAVVFAVVPVLASQFKKLYAHIEPPASWSALYAFEILGDDGHLTTFRLVPRKHGRVAYLDVGVDDATATIRAYRWSYEDGGYIAFDQTFTTIDGNYLVNAQSGHVELSSYKADVTSTLSHYQLNVPIDDAVFGQTN